MKRVLAALRSLPPAAVLALGLVVPVVYAFPGMMSQDSFDILLEARSGVFTDAHPPINAALWRVIDAIVPGGIGLLAIQLVAFELGVFLILRRTFSPRRAAWLAAALFVYPPVLAPMGMIWKDCLMAGMLALGTGGLLSERRGARLAGLAALWLATACRYNAFAIVLPLVVLLFEWRPGLRAVQRYAIATAVWLAVTASAFGANKLLTDREMYFWHSTLAVYDIAGILVNLDGELADADMEQLLAGTEPLIHERMHAALRERYTPRDFFSLTSPEKSPMWNLPLYGEPAPAARRAAIEALWWKLVREHPGAYLAHRLAVTREVLALGSERRPIGAIPRRDPYYPGIALSLGLGTRWSTLQRHLSHALIAVWRTLPIFAPWIYLVVALALLWPARRHRDVLALLLGGIFLEGTLFILAMSPDYRYSHWMIVSVCLSVVILVARRFRVARVTRDAADRA